MLNSASPLNVHVYDSQDALSIEPQDVKNIAEAVVHLEEQTFQEVAVHLVETQKICELHEEYFDDPSTTDTISFPTGDSSELTYRVLGDVFVCPETAMTYASQHSSDPYTETTLYIVHGLLHLLGYDDIEDEDRHQMRAAEARHMENLYSLNLTLTPERT